MSQNKIEKPEWITRPCDAQCDLDLALGNIIEWMNDFYGVRRK